MNTLNLYNLPKDILVKLICEIRQELEQENEKLNKNLQIYKDEEILVLKCKHPDCGVIEIGRKGVHLYGVCLYVCKICRGNVCDKHVDFGTGMCLECDV